MPRRTLTRTLVNATAVVGITAGSLAGTGVSSAAPQPATQSAASTRTFSVLAVNNLGLDNTRAKHWQCFLLKGWGFDPGAIDGQLGTKSWTAAQQFFNWEHWYVDKPLVEDGVVGTETIKALQNFLGVATDGIAGSQTKAAFASRNDWDWCKL